MEDGQFREAESEEQKSLPFNFRAPRLQLTQDKSQARIFWQSQGQIIADHKQQMVKSIGKDNRTSLYSSWMAPTDAQRKLQTLLADLGKGTSWLNMYKMTAKACEAIQPLPHNFAMPKVEPHLSDTKFARIHWQQMGRVVAAHTSHLKQSHLSADRNADAAQLCDAQGGATPHLIKSLLASIGNRGAGMSLHTRSICSS